MARRYISKKRVGLEPIELDGVTFQVEGGVSLLDLVEVARMGESDSGSAEGVAALGEFFEGALGKQEYARFRKHCREHSTDPDTLVSIMQDLVEDVTEHPTQRPSPSPDGQTATGTTYKAVSPSGTVTVLPLTPEREAELRAAVLEQVAELHPTG